MDKKERFEGVCNFLAAHWKAGTYDKIADLSWISEDKLATKKLAAEIAVEYKYADDALNSLWHSNADIFIEALKLWASSRLAVIDFFEIYSDVILNN